MGQYCGVFWDDIEVIPAGITLVGIVLGFYFFGDVAMIATIATKDLTKNDGEEASPKWLVVQACSSQSYL